MASVCSPTVWTLQHQLLWKHRNILFSLSHSSSKRFLIYHDVFEVHMQQINQLKNCTASTALPVASTAPRSEAFPFSLVFIWEDILSICSLITAKVCNRSSFYFTHCTGHLPIIMTFLHLRYSLDKTMICITESITLGPSLKPACS